MPEHRAFRFGPRDRRGLIAGVRTGQAVVVVTSLLLGLAGLYALRGGERALVAVVLLLGAAVAFLPVGGRTLEEWAPVAARFSSGAALGTRRDTVRPTRGPRPPAALAAFSVLELALPDGASIGALHDARAGTLSAVLSAEGGAFALLDPSERARLIEAWSSVLASAAHGTAPARLQWIVRSVPDAAAELRERIAATWKAPAAAAVRSARASYESFVARERAGALRQETLLVVTVRAPSSARRAGEAAHALAGAVASYAHRLREAGVSLDGLASAPGLRAMLRRSFDPTPLLGEVHFPWPVDVDETWATLRTDATWHASYWIAEWPRHEVGSDFLLPLVAGAAERRAVSVVMAPIAPTKATRSAERARTSVIADDELRRRHGFALSARTRREQQAVLRREGELAEGHAAYRFSGFVTVSAASAEELEGACSRVEQAGALARLELRRLYGSQAEGFCCTLPVARGCR
ncbi:MAG TPA: SCO6880 family protein [Acidimicrobiales bacterium]|nr:SCO6880 family protein [Acidimicrobiales bacterium]